MKTITLVNEETKTRKEFTHDEITIGRDENCDFTTPPEETHISRHHCTIIQNEKGVSIRDDGSKFDVAKAREYGTKDHWVEPIGGVSGTSSNLPKALHWVTSTGQDAFSKGHMVKGIKKSEIVKKTVKANQARVKERLRAEFKAWRADILNL